MIALPPDKLKIKSYSEQEVIAKRVAKELKDGDVVNLGIGIPTLVSNFISKSSGVIITSENGMIGVGESPGKGDSRHPDLINAGGDPVSEMNGTSFIDSALSFGIIRGGHLDVTVLGALQVDSFGSIANWMIPGKLTPGMGGAMDLCVGAKRVIAAFKHVDKKGNSKIVLECTLPLTAYKRVSLIVTDMAVIEVNESGLILKEVSYDYTVEDVVKATDAKLIVGKNIDVFG